MTVRPLSARNPRVQRLARLARRREDRAGERAFLVEGPVLLGTALDAGAEVREVFVAAGAPPRPATAEVLNWSKQRLLGAVQASCPGERIIDISVRVRRAERAPNR